MQAVLEFMPGADPRLPLLRPRDMTFQGLPATLHAGRYTHAEPLSRNIKRVWKGRSLNSWKSAQTSAHWYLEFERAGHRFCLHYSSPCGGFTQVDYTSIPSEVMGYFKTFQYDPDVLTQLDDVWWSQTKTDSAD